MKLEIKVHPESMTMPRSFSNSYVYQAQAQSPASRTSSSLPPNPHFLRQPMEHTESDSGSVNSYVEQGQAAQHRLTTPPTWQPGQPAPLPQVTSPTWQLEHPPCPPATPQTHHVGGHAYAMLYQRQDPDCLQMTLERPLDKQGGLEFILSIDKVTQFLLNKGNHFDVRIYEWEYDSLARFQWYHGNIDKEEARRRLDLNQVQHIHV